LQHFRREYRAEIDGLRAVAVLAVVIFHAAPNILPGGFVGVDVFFVISGYLITRNIISDIQHDEFSFRRFYIRRIRRLFPAQLVTVAISLLASIVILTPKHLEEFAASAIFSLGSLANIYFWQQSGYFDDQSIFKPLLHFWSLGVEEQFYLVWPAFIVAAHWFRARLPGLLLLIAVASVLASQTWVTIDPVSAFYLAPFRMFEFAIGAACLWLPSRVRSPAWTRESAMTAGLLLIGYCSLFYTKDTAFPGVAAVVPCVGAGLVIVGTQSKAGCILTNRAALWLGLISYSLYLVHWPIIIFYKYLRFGPLSAIESISLIAISIMSASALYYGVERRLRYASEHKSSWKPITALTASLLAITVWMSLLAWHQQGWPWRLQGRAALYWTQIGDPTNGIACSKPSYYRDGAWFCQFGQDKGDHFDVVLLGDSHAWHWLAGLDALFRKNEWSGVSFGGGGSLPFVDALRYDGNVALPAVIEQNRAINEVTLRIKPAVVIISARWAIHVLTTREPGEDGARKFLTYKQHQDLTASSSRLAVTEALIDTVERFKNAGIYTVLLGEVPYPGPAASECLTRANWIIQLPTDANCQQTSIDEAQIGAVATNDILENTATEFPNNVSAFLPSNYMCKGKMNCDFIDEGGSYYWINGHLSRYGSITLSEKYFPPMIEVLRRQLKSSHN
jgi:peptidoglycan/LPS O-acetylase OafA/YrhL